MHFTRKFASQHQLQEFVVSSVKIIEINVHETIAVIHNLW